MRILLVLTCCVGLASFAGAAQPEEAGNHQGKKKGNGNAPVQQQQLVAPQTGKKFKTGPGGGQHTQNFQQQGTANYTVGNKGKNKWQAPVTGQNQTNISGGASSTTFNKSKKFGTQGNFNPNKGMKFQKKQ